MNDELAKPPEPEAPVGQTALERADFCAQRADIRQACAEYARAILDDEPAARIALGCFLRSLGCRSEAVAQFQKVLELARRTNDARLRACACNNLAVMHRDAGNLNVAASYQQRSFAAESRLPTPEADSTLACDLSNLANDALLRGDYRTASRLLESALEIDSRHQANLADQAADWGSLGLVHLMEHRFLEALRCLRTSLRMHRELGDARGMGCNMLHLGQVCGTLGDWRRAERWFGWAVRALRVQPHGEIHDEAESLLELAQRHRRVAECNPLCN